MAGYQWSEFWHGGTEAVTGIGHLLWDYSTPRMIIDHDGVTDSEIALAKGLGHEITHPIALVKSLTDYDTLTTSPARFAGHLIPDLIAAAATAGTATAATRTAEATARATKAAEVAAKATEDLAANTADDIGAVATHPPNSAMVEGIQDAITSGRPLSPGEQYFMTHELTEAEAMANGLAQDAAHAAALETHPPFMNYTPEIIQRFPEYFNSNWRNAWGIG